MSAIETEKQTLATLLLKDRSKPYINQMVTYVGEDLTRTTALVELMLEDIKLVSFRAAWVLGDAARKYPKMKSTYLGKLIDALHVGMETGIKRNICRIMQESDIDAAHLGLAVSKSFDLVTAAKESIAVKACCITVLQNAAYREPELKRELKLVLEEIIPTASPGIRNRALKTLNTLNL